MTAVRSLLTSILLLASAVIAQADPQTDVVTPTGWWWMANTTMQELEDRVDEGYRIVDIEIESVSPLRVSAALVRNSGDYAKNWWWLVDVQPSALREFMEQRNARLIDLEPLTPAGGGLSYAAVMIENVGSDYYEQHGWLTAYTASDLNSWVTDTPDKRMISIQPMGSGGIQTYAIIWVENRGANYTPWWWMTAAPASRLADELDLNDARLIDLEVHDGSGRVSAVMLPRDGNGFYWLRGLQFEEVDHVARGYAARIIDLERYDVGGGEFRYGMVLRRNDNHLAVQTAFAMRQTLTPAATNGFLLREIGASSGTRAGVHENRIFEPASLLKTAHHFTALRTVSIGADDLDAQVIENMGVNLPPYDSCPDGTMPISRPFRDILRAMMEGSSNTATKAVTDRYGPLMIESVSGAFGAADVTLRHDIGCGCTVDRNEATLGGLASLHDSVADGALGEFRDDFYELMPNDNELGMGANSVSSMIANELVLSGMSGDERDAFISLAFYAHKPGGYDCPVDPDNAYYRSRGGYVRLPFRGACGIELREFFIGAWVEGVEAPNPAEDAVGAGMTSLVRNVVRDAIGSWETANCPGSMNYCNANLNSTGQIGLCLASGSTVAANNSLAIRGSQYPLNTLGYLLVSDAAGFVPNPGGSSGNLCLGGQLGRYAANIQSSGPQGEFSQSLDLSAIPFASGSYSVQIGDSLFFQYWHRDSENGVPTSNLSQGLRVNFL
ncbi:MAG: serine hydrolase [Planctomycetota bacterium]